jgi:hypothetical protein
MKSQCLYSPLPFPRLEHLKAIFILEKQKFKKNIFLVYFIRSLPSISCSCEKCCNSQMSTDLDKTDVWIRQKQTDKKTNKQTETYIQTDKQTNKQTDKEINRQTDFD